MHFATLRVGRASYALAFFFSLFGTSLAQRGFPLPLWNPGQGTVNGYAVYVGSTRVDVGNTTSSHDDDSGQPGSDTVSPYAAYNTTGEGPKSGQACGYSNEFPTLMSPANQSSSVGQAVSLQLAAE